MRLTASDIKVEEESDVPEEKDPLAITLTATKAEEEVSYIQQSSYSLALLGRRCCKKYPSVVCGWIWAVLMQVFMEFVSASKTVVGYCLNRRQQLF
jgi:hypothetical protein